MGVYQSLELRLVKILTINKNFRCRKQILDRHDQRALRTMKSLSDFDSAFQRFVQEESRLQAEGILREKDPSKNIFSLENLRQFSYKEQLHKFQRTNPVLMASIVGTLSRSKGVQPDDLSRKGFGGSNREEEIDLVPCVVQTISRLLKNRHPSSIATLPSLNSLYMWTNRVPGNLFHFYNALGDTFRYALLSSLDSPEPAHYPPCSALAAQNPVDAQHVTLPSGTGSGPILATMPLISGAFDAEFFHF